MRSPFTTRLIIYWLPGRGRREAEQLGWGPRAPLPAPTGLCSSSSLQCLNPGLLARLLWKHPPGEWESCRAHWGHPDSALGPSPAIASKRAAGWAHGVAGSLPGPGERVEDPLVGLEPKVQAQPRSRLEEKQPATVPRGPPLGTGWLGPWDCHVHRCRPASAPPRSPAPVSSPPQEDHLSCHRRLPQGCAHLSGQCHHAEMGHVKMPRP